LAKRKTLSAGARRLMLPQISITRSERGEGRSSIRKKGRRYCSTRGEAHLVAPLSQSIWETKERKKSRFEKKTKRCRLNNRGECELEQEATRNGRRSRLQVSRKKELMGQNRKPAQPRRKGRSCIVRKVKPGNAQRSNQKKRAAWGS